MQSRRHDLRMLLCAAAAALAVAGNAMAANDADFRRRAHVTGADTDTNLEDIKTEVRFGREVAARILGRERLYEHADLTRYVGLVGQTLANNGQRAELQYHFAILDADDVNAYSAPGGYVFITRGALQRMRDEAELAAVLAHEIAHVQQRHIVKALNIRAADTTLASGLSILFGGATDTARAAFFQAVDRATSLLFEEGYRVQDELEADRVAVLLLSNTGYDPTALRRYLLRVASDDGIANNARRTHPSGAERMTALDETMRAHALEQLIYPRHEARFQSNAAHQ
jgi:predicted Zn-dependent protease